jgi:D-alanyl-D-alanine carboxypeptidase/D-alanyl-D-alanine-endopeptidase (penicillin-binding protein 4)
MKLYPNWVICPLMTLLFPLTCLTASEEGELPKDIQKIMHQSKYEHSIWGLFVKDLQTGKVLFDLNSEKLFSPASTTKIFSVSALLHTFGDDYRFKTPVFASSRVKDGKLQGDLIIVAQGDFTLGGRQPDADTIAFTKLDHTIANFVPGTILTTEDPLKGISDLAKQVYDFGIREIIGDVFIDDSLFETTETRDMVLAPMMINENYIDIIINPTIINQKANVTWRPVVKGYSVDNQVETVEKTGAFSIQITADKSGQNIVVKGTIQMNQRDLVQTFTIKEPNAFASAAFIQALEKQGVVVNLTSDKSTLSQPLSSFRDLQQVAVWTSPPLSEYAKLILKVSHNLGADLIPLLLASQQGKKTYEEGMLLLGNFATQNVKLSPDSFVFLDAAGGNDNRLTPAGEVKLLEFMQGQSPEKFKKFFDALPILGQDGSLEDYAKKTEAVGKVRAKPGTGVSMNAATGNYFLITQALAGYIEGKNGHLLGYMLVVNNAQMPTINDVRAIFEDGGQISSAIYDLTKN